jgi:methylthioxylose transferase
MYLRRGLTPFVSLLCLLGCGWWSYKSFEFLTSEVPPHILGQRVRTAAPVYANLRASHSPEAAFHTLLAVATVAIAIAVAWQLAKRVRRVWVVVIICCLLAFVVNVMVARIDKGHASIIEPFSRTRLEYFGDVPRVRDDPIQFIQDYHRINPRLSLHAGTHPPGAVVLLWCNSKLFGKSIEAASFAAIILGALCVVPAYGLVCAWLGNAIARRSLPMMLVTPSLVILGATSMDAVFLLFTLIAMWAGAVALGPTTSGVSRLIRIVWAGIALFIATFFTFASIVAVVWFVCVWLTRPNWRGAINITSVGIVFVLVGLLAYAWGYDMPQVIAAALHRDHRAMGDSGASSMLLYFQWSVGNGLAFLFGTGLAISAAMLTQIVSPHARVRRTAIAMVLTLLALSSSTLFSFETERVWLPLAVTMVACGASSLRHARIRFLIVVLCAVQTLLTQYYLNTWW